MKKKTKARKVKKRGKAKKKAKRGGKSTAVQTLVRQNQVFKLLLEGRPRRHIVKYSANKWGIGPDQVDKYIKKCNDTWAESSRMDRESELSKEIERAEDLLRKVMKRKAYQTAISAMKHLCMLKRLNNLEIDFKGAITLENRLEGMSDEEINKVEKEISNRLASSGIDLKRKRPPKATKGGGG